MPIYQCNLRYSYCFQDHMRTDPSYSHLLRVMTRDVVDRIFEGISHIESAHGLTPEMHPSRTVDFYGGEPFLASNVAIIVHIKDKTLRLGPATFWAVSNATELHAYKHLLSPERISNIQITLDGPPEEHDKRRIHADGTGSFTQIAENITMRLNRGVAISIRLNIDKNNFSRLPDTLNVIEQHGWNKYPQFGVYTANVRSYNDKVNPSECMDTWELDKAVAELQETMEVASLLASPDDSIKQQARRLFHDPGKAIPTLKDSFCSAHTGMYIFDCFADIYACWEKTGDTSVRVGRIEQDGQLVMNLSLL